MISIIISSVSYTHLTGAAGFIGANYIKYILAKHDDIKVVILDALTYAGNLGTIAKDIDDDRCIFVKGDICDRMLADELFAKYKFDYVVNFAAESHVAVSYTHLDVYKRQGSHRRPTLYTNSLAKSLP